LALSTLELDLPEIEKRIRRFINNYVENSGATGIVLGLSGGIDSNTIGALSSLSIGGNRVLGLMLPEEETYNPRDIDDAKLVAKKFGFRTQICDITKVLESFYKAIPTFDPADRVCKGNIKARTRMICLYYYSNRLCKVVCGCSDKSETMMGYFTKWGDAAADISPLMDLYKTQVRQLAAYIGVPEEIIEKPSSPQLWPGQTAENELGVKYEMLDLVLLGLENFMSVDEIAQQLGKPIKLIQDIKNTWLAREHKRRLPLAIKLGYRTVGTDFRLPYTLP